MTTKSGRVAESLLKGAKALQSAPTGVEVRVAIRDGLLGLEYHLDTLARELARDPALPGALEPSLRGRAQKAEADLRAVLISAWALLMLTDDELGKPEHAQHLAKQLEAVDHDEVTLVFDQLLSPQGID